MASNEVTVLLVEDDPIDVDAVQRAFRKARIRNPIVTAKDGLDALEMLRREGGVARPYLILLDLNMPRMNGLEFLEELRSDEALAGAVVFVLTTSDAHRDIWAAYDKRVAGYILKSNVGEDFIKVLMMLENYWRVVELPVGPTESDPP